MVPVVTRAHLLSFRARTASSVRNGVWSSGRGSRSAHHGLRLNFCRDCTKEPGGGRGIGPPVSETGAGADCGAGYQTGEGISLAVRPDTRSTDHFRSLGSSETPALDRTRPPSARTPGGIVDSRAAAARLDTELSASQTAEALRHQ